MSDLKVNDAIRPMLAALSDSGSLETGVQPVATSGRNDGSPAPEARVLTMTVPVADPNVPEEVKKTGLLVLPLLKEQYQPEVSPVNARTFNDAQIATLPQLSHQIVWLKLGNTQISNAALV